MIAVLVRVVLWLAVGHAVLGGVFWGLLHVPESNVLMLSLSALLVLLLVVIGAWVETSAALIWLRRYTFGERAVRGITVLPGFVCALAVFGVLWWLSGAAGAWAGAHRGEIDAVLMARAGWTRTGWLHASIAWVLWFVRYPVALAIALTLMLSVAVHGLAAFARPGWLARSVRPVRLALVTLLLLVFLWLPWQAAYWAPRLPATWLEPVFVSVKLFLIYILANVGWALVLRTVVRAADGRGSAPVQPGA